VSDGPDGLRTVVMERSARQAEAVIRDRPEFAGDLAIGDTTQQYLFGRSDHPSRRRHISMPWINVAP
jgi:hypothetical protein